MTNVLCKKCKKQYTVQITDNFRGRWNNCKSKSKSYKRGEKCMQEHLYKYFEKEGPTEFLDDVSITLIDKTENYWMRTLKTFAPYGLHVEDSIWRGMCMSGEKRFIPCCVSPGFGF